MDYKVILALVAILVILWPLINHADRFGVHFYGLTTYNRIPIPYLDVIVHTDGSMSLREGKSHYITANDTEPLFDEGAELVIIGAGYSGQVYVEPEVESRLDVEVFKTPDAIHRFNNLRGRDAKIAVIIHSTC